MDYLRLWEISQLKRPTEELKTATCLSPLHCGTIKKRNNNNNKKKKKKKKKNETFLALILLWLFI
jgi:hypothetical protein